MARFPMFRSTKGLDELLRFFYFSCSDLTCTVTFEDIRDADAVLEAERYGFNFLGHTVQVTRPFDDDAILVGHSEDLEPSEDSKPSEDPVAAPLEAATAAKTEPAPATPKDRELRSRSTQPREHREQPQDHKSSRTSTPPFLYVSTLWLAFLVVRSLYH